MSAQAHAIDPSVIAARQTIENALLHNARVELDLPAGGRVEIDRQLPFVCVGRGSPGSLAGYASRLLATQATYIAASDAPEFLPSLRHLCEGLARALSEQFDGVLILELWASAPGPRETLEQESVAMTPGFRILTADQSLPTTVQVLEQALRSIRIDGRPAAVETAVENRLAPPDLQPLLLKDWDLAGCCYLGIEVKPIFYDPHRQRVLPHTYAALRSQLTFAIRRGLAAFAGSTAALPPVHFESLGTHTLEVAAGDIDRQLSDISQAYEFLLALTPINSEQAWHEFRSSRYQHAPTFFYRPLSLDIDLTKRRLFNVRLENVTDPTLEHLLRQKRDEIDLELTMLQYRDEPRFRHAAVQMFGEVPDDLLQTAHRVLEVCGARKAREAGGGSKAAAATVTAEQFCKIARKEILYYRNLHPEFDADVQLRDDISGGLMVSRNKLLVPSDLQLLEARVPALLQHEIGTHLLTYFNGRQQPFRQMATGLAGYEPLQEGLAVLSEYLVGGLSLQRMRTLALRVVAAAAMLDNADFVQVFRLLRQDHGLGPHRAFTLVSRVFRGGGFPKDIVYLQGLHALLSELKNVAEFSLMLVGKIALSHMPYIRELRRREIVQPPLFLPRGFDEPEYQDRLQRAAHQSVDLLLRKPI